jgi:hypothetical protein
MDAEPFTNTIEYGFFVWFRDSARAVANIDDLLRCVDFYNQPVQMTDISGNEDLLNRTAQSLPDLLQTRVRGLIGSLQLLAKDCLDY